MGLLAVAIYEASIVVGEHPMTSTHIAGLSAWGFFALAAVVIASILGFVAWRRGRQRMATPGGAE